MNHTVKASSVNSIADVILKREQNSMHEGYLTVHLPHEIIWNVNLMKQGNFIDISLARYVSGTHAHHQEH